MRSACIQGFRIPGTINTDGWGKFVVLYHSGDYKTADKGETLIESSQMKMLNKIMQKVVFGRYGRAEREDCIYNEKVNRNTEKKTG